MTNDPFAAPAAPGSGISWADFQGALLMITPKSVETGIQTAYGVSDAVKADVVVLDGPHAPAEIGDTLVFPKLLQSQLSSRIGQRVLGRLGQGQGKPGQSPPWLLSEATDQDKQVGIQWLNRQSGQQIAQPAAQQQPAAQPAQQQTDEVPF